MAREKQRTPIIHRRGLWVTVGLILLVFFVIYLVLGFLVAPRIVHDQVTTRLSEMTGREVVAESVQVNPLRLSLTINGFRIRGENAGDAAGQDLVQADRIHVNGSSRSIFNMAGIAQLVRVEGLRLHVIRERQGVFNFQDILDRMNEQAVEESESASEPIRFHIDKIELIEGSVAFEDNALSSHFSYNFSPINATLSDVGTLSSDPGQAALSVGLADPSDPIEWEGRNNAEAGDESREAPSSKH